MIGLQLYLLAQDGHGGGQLVYIIAILILSGLGALFEKLKQKREQQTTSRSKPAEAPPTAPRRAEAPGPPARAEQSQPRAPVPPPPIPRREAIPVPPQRPVPSPPPARRPMPVGRDAPPIPRRPIKPPPRPQEAPQRRPVPEPKRPMAVPQPAKIPSVQMREEARSAAQASSHPLSQLSKPAPRAKRRLTPHELRRAIVMNEILQPPVGLR